MFGPNITGVISESALGSDNLSANGAFNATYHSENKGYSTDRPIAVFGFTFDANRTSTIYSGNRLQPSALQVLPCIRF